MYSENYLDIYDHGTTNALATARASTIFLILKLHTSARALDSILSMLFEFTFVGVCPVCLKTSWSLTCTFRYAKKSFS